MKNKDAWLVQSMLDASIHGVMLLQPVKDKHGAVTDFSIEAANAAIESQVGFQLDQSAGTLLSTVFPQYKNYGFFAVYEATLKTGILQRCELFYEDDRLKGWFDLGVSPNKDAVVVTFVNITQAKQNQQAVEHAAAQLQAIMDISQSGMFMFAPVFNEYGDVTDFRFTKANRSLAAYVGQEPETIIGGLGSQWFPGYKTNGLFELYRHTFTSGQTNRFDFHYNDDAIDAWLDIMATKLGNEVLVTFTDFTSKKKLHLQLETTVNELRRSNANLEEFAYAASHDLQEPLRKINFYADRLKQRFEPVLNTDGLHMLERMEAASDRMRTLIDDLLAYSRVSSKRVPFEPVDTKIIVKEVLTDMETHVREKKAVVYLHNLPALLGDKVQLRQLFQNLISNALKYSQTNKAPVINIQSSLIKGRDAGIEMVQLDLNKNFHLIEVIDNGMGFEQENAKKIFQIFQRLHGRSEYPGTGVGLAIVQKVVENHNGYIYAQSEPDKGSLFRILLPADD